jgi:hypothetical protein
MAAIASLLPLTGCGTKQTLEQAVHCDDFERLADGTWSTNRDVSLDYLSNGIENQLNISKGVAVNRIVGGQKRQLLPVLERKCAPSR